jgi:Uma2 family endonuclease
LTPEEYLKIERAAEERHEYFDGQMWAMVGGTARQSLIIFNLGGELRSGLRGRGCFVMGQDLRTSVAYEGLYTYPDLVVVCGKIQFAELSKDMITNPCLILEVLSPSTEGYDRGFKFAQYRRIESLQEYAMVSQVEPRVEVYRRQPNGQWLLSDFAGLEATCVFESVDCRVPLAEIYFGVPWDTPDASRPPGGDFRRRVDLSYGSPAQTAIDARGVSGDRARRRGTA